MLEEITELHEQALSQIAQAGNDDAVEEVRIRYLGRRSRLREIMSSIGALPAGERPAVGQAAGQTQKAIESALADRRCQLDQDSDDDPGFDVTLPGRPPMAGKLHPLSRLTEDAVGILKGMGFTVADGPEIDDEYHNFDALNTPADHPSRDLHDTFYLKDGRLLRTQTSTVQIRVMQSSRPPLRIIAPGRCYRRDTVDATHHMV